MSTEALAKVNDLRGLLEKSKSRLSEVAPKHLKVDRLVRLMLSACTRNPKILECTQESVLQFCMKCSETGLEPIGAGGAWAVPFGRELTFIPDYRGLINCAKRSGAIKDAYAEVVYQNDEFDYAMGLEPYLKHKPVRGDRGALEAAYCIMVFPDDTKRFVVMDARDIESIKRRSKAASSGPWKTDEAQMWCKTVCRRAMKPFVGASPELDAAIAADDKAGAVLDAEPIAQPKALPEGTETAKEPESHAGDPKALECTCILTGITPKKNKEIGVHWLIQTQGEGIFLTADQKHAEKAAVLIESKDFAAIQYTEADGHKTIVRIE